jgi:hypothetical protein
MSENSDSHQGKIPVFYIIENIIATSPVEDRKWRHLRDNSLIHIDFYCPFKNKPKS